MPKSRALIVVQRYFPQVTRLKDAKKPVTIEVLRQDLKGADRKSMNNCAMARACVRAADVDGALVSPARAYLIEGKVATRYDMPASVSQEVKIYDRAGSFMPGTYRLGPIAPYHRLGTHHGERGAGEQTGTQVQARRHYTAGIRKFA